MALAYDITRLISRVSSVTPNGIDRIDYALAHHYLNCDGPNATGVVAAGLRPQLMSQSAALAAIEGIATHWGEETAPEDDAGLNAVIARLRGVGLTPNGKEGEARRIVAGRSGRIGSVLAWTSRYGLSIGSSPRKRLPASARYLNVSQFPLWIESYFDWLRARRDVKAIFFVHDLLPLTFPEYFPRGEHQRHRLRLANLAQFASAALVTSNVVKAELSACMRKLGRSDMPILAAPIPVAPLFSQLPVRDPRLASTPYFVCCGTLEPRKNHLLLLNVWRELARHWGNETPKLILIGKRGWHYDLLIAALQQSPALRDHVIEVAGLTSPALKRLLDNAKALLMPSFGEGYGLPVREALAAGTHVIASDIDAFREILAPDLELISPFNGDAWLAAIHRAVEDKAYAARPPSRIVPQAATDASSLSETKINLRPSDATGQSNDWAAYFDKIDAFLRDM